MKRLFILPIILLATFSLVVPNLQAQSEEPTPTPEPASQDPERSDIPLVHTVQEGETLFSIAQQYDITVEVLQQLNNIADPSFIYIGQELILPGGGGETVATIHTIQIGDSLKSIAAIYNTTVEALAGENRLINPAYLAAGNPLTIMSRTGTAEPQPFAGYAHVVRPGDTLLTIAAEHNLTPAQIAAANDLPYPPYLFLGQRLRIPGEGQYQILPGYWQQVRMVPATLVQGKSAAIYVESLEPGLPDGQFAGQSLNFVPHGAGYLAFVGLDAFTDTGRYELLLGGTGDEPGQSFSQEVEVISGEYGIQSLTIPEQLSHLLAPEVRADEEALLAPIFTQVSQPAQWTGLFQMPVSNAPISAGYGDARSYNEGPIEIFHTGVDFVGPVGIPIHAAAAGTVIYSDTLPLHGSTVIVDHGLGVMTAYYHLAKGFVDVGAQVTQGQIIAEGGSTGLSSGPHLHWDLRINNVPVNGLQWTEEDLLSAVIPGDPTAGIMESGP